MNKFAACLTNYLASYSSWVRRCPWIGLAGVGMNDFFDNWTVQVRKGVLEFCILRSLEQGERYGYELVKSLASVPGLGLTEGTLYPLLSRLRVAGLVTTRLEESNEGPARKYYSLSREGRRILAAMKEFLDALNEGTRTL